MNILELSEQEIVRRNNLQQLRDLGIDPYPAAAYPTDAFSTEIKENFVDLPTIKNEEGEDVPTPATPENSRMVCVAGRIMSKRVQGKAAFVELLDSKGPEAVAQWVLDQKKLLITDTTMRDAHQSIRSGR